jgi:hypothetical protein
VQRITPPVARVTSCACLLRLDLASLLVVVALGLDASGQGISGTVKAVDLKASSFTLTLDKGKDRTFLVDAKTEFWGPKAAIAAPGPRA